MKPIPISAGKRIADQFGYDQVVIVARKVGEAGVEHVTTYGVNMANCGAAARIGDFFKHKLMGWPRQDPALPFQTRVAPWMQECFGAAVAQDVRERGDRLLEEVLELLQSHGYDPARVATLRDYVFSRPVGEPAQEVGGVMVTLAAYCLATGLDMHDAGDIELARVWTKIDAIRVKQASKRDIHSPLPGAPAVAGAGCDD